MKTDDSRRSYSLDRSETVFSSDGYQVLNVLELSVTYIFIFLTDKYNK